MYHGSAKISESKRHGSTMISMFKPSWMVDEFRVVHHPIPIFSTTFFIWLVVTGTFGL
jgi:hypothetical protein